MVYRTDYHMHSNYSDGRSAPEDYIIAALAAGLSEIGFSEHLTLFQGPRGMEYESFKNHSLYHIILKISGISIQISKLKLALKLIILSGKEEEILSFLSPLPLDYIIGSVHYLGEKTVDFGPEFYLGKSIDRLFESYFHSVAAAAASGLFDIIGHCDLIRIYGFKPSADQEPLYRMLARAMKTNGVAFELNTNGRNRPLADFYPDRKFLHIFREENVPVCVNSDAHMPSRVGQYFDEAYELLRYVGFTEMAVFDKRVRHMVPF